MRRVQQRGGLAAYVIVGAALPSGHHTPRFDFDEAALPIGVKLLGGLAWDLATRPLGPGPAPAAPGVRP
jgi:aminobenzoyl-glutamate utilization protein A